MGERFSCRAPSFLPAYNSGSLATFEGSPIVAASPNVRALRVKQSVPQKSTSRAKYCPLAHRRDVDTRARPDAAHWHPVEQDET